MVFHSVDGAEDAAGAAGAGAAAGAGVEEDVGGGVGVLLSAGADAGLSQPARQMAATKGNENFMFIFSCKVVQNV